MMSHGMTQDEWRADEINNFYSWICDVRKHILFLMYSGNISVRHDAPHLTRIYLYKFN